MRNLARKVKRVIKSLLGKNSFAKIDCDYAKERFGSEYGGWDLATGRMDANSIVYSFGVGEDASFDIALMQRFGLTVHAFDPTPKSIEWVKNQDLSPNFILHEYGIANVDGNVSFRPPDDPTHISHTILDRPSTESRSITVPVKRLSTIMAELGHSRIDVLKMDIEGAEYAVLDDMEQKKIRPYQILVEFHDRFPNVGIRKTKRAIRRLRKIGYGLFSISASGQEFCFILKAH